MVKTKVFRAQHDKLLALAETIRGYFATEFTKSNALDIRLALSKMMGVLQVHLAAEDEYLYPQLMKSNDPQLRDLAKLFVEEMGGIAKTFTAYYEKWSVTTITTDAQEFINATEEIFNVLIHRIERENNELYPLVDKLDIVK